MRHNQSYYAYGRNPDSPNTGGPAEDISVISPSAGGQQLGGQELAQFGQLGVYALMDAVHSFAATQAACAAAPAGAACPPVLVRTAGVANFPNQKITDSGFWGSVGFLFALLMIIALLLPLSNVIKVGAACTACLITHILRLLSKSGPCCVAAGFAQALVQEKETKMREVRLRWPAWKCCL